MCEIVDVFWLCVGFSQAFYFIIKSHESAGLYEDYHTTWIGMFHMTLGDYDYGMLGSTPYPKMAKVVFVLFQEWPHDWLIFKIP
jgi:hypothetical protein